MIHVEKSMFHARKGFKNYLKFIIEMEYSNVNYDNNMVVIIGKGNIERSDIIKKRISGCKYGI